MDGFFRIIIEGLLLVGPVGLQHALVFGNRIALTDDPVII